MTEQQALLRAVLEDPEDDTVRLAYADWLDENPGTMTCPACKPYADAKNWVPGHTPNPYSRPYWQPCSRCKATTVVPDGRAHQAEFIRRQILNSKRARDRMWNEKFRKAAHNAGHEWAEEWLRGDTQGLHRRGFISEITTVVSRFLLHAEAWFSAYPITVVQFEDLDSSVGGVSSPGWYRWGEERTIEPEADDVPEKLWDGLAATGIGRPDYSGLWYWYDSAEDADLALSKACVAYGRKLAGLTERVFT